MTAKNAQLVRLLEYPNNKTTKRSRIDPATPIRLQIGDETSTWCEFSMACVPAVTPEQQPPMQRKQHQWIEITRPKQRRRRNLFASDDEGSSEEDDDANMECMGSSCCSPMMHPIVTSPKAAGMVTKRKPGSEQGGTPSIASSALDPIVRSPKATTVTKRKPDIRQDGAPSIGPASMDATDKAPPPLQNRCCLETQLADLQEEAWLTSNQKARRAVSAAPKKEKTAPPLPQASSPGHQQTPTDRNSTLFQSTQEASSVPPTLKLPLLPQTSCPGQQQTPSDKSSTLFQSTQEASSVPPTPQLPPLPQTSSPGQQQTPFDLSSTLFQSTQEASSVPPTPQLPPLPQTGSPEQQQTPFDKSSTLFQSTQEASSDENDCCDVVVADGEQNSIRQQPCRSQSQGLQGRHSPETAIL